MEIFGHPMLLKLLLSNYQHCGFVSKLKKKLLTLHATFSFHIFIVFFRLVHVIERILRFKLASFLKSGTLFYPLRPTTPSLSCGNLITAYGGSLSISWTHVLIIYWLIMLVSSITCLILTSFALMCSLSKLETYVMAQK